MTAPERPPRRPAAILAYKALASVMIALAFAGLVLPGLPAMPFLLVAAWAYDRADPTLRVKLEAHPRFGPMLRNWRERRVVPLRAKILAVASMSVSVALLAASGAGTTIVLSVAAILVCVATYLISRPSA